MNILDPAHPIHAPRTHTAAIGVALASVIGVAAIGGAKLSSVKEPPSYSISESALDALPFGHHDYTIFAASGAGKLPERLAVAIRKAGDSVQMQDALFMSHSGIAVSPDTPEGHALADALSKAINEPVRVAPGTDGPFEIGIGPPMDSP